MIERMNPKSQDIIYGSDTCNMVRTSNPFDTSVLSNVTTVIHYVVSLPTGYKDESVMFCWYF